MKSIEFFEHTQPREMIDCRITTIRDIFHYYGIPVDSFSLFLMLDVPDFRFGIKYFSENNNLPLWLAGSSCDKLEDHAIELLHVPWKEVEIGRDAPLSAVGSYIDAGIPVIYSLDSGCIIDKFKPKPVVEGAVKLSNLSLVTAIGYDSESEHVLLDLKDDEYIETAFERFQKARFSKCWPESPEGRCFDAGLTEDYLAQFRENADSLLVKGILTTCRRMLAEKTDFQSENSKEEYVTGVKGIAFMARTLEEFRQSVASAKAGPELISRVSVLEIMTLRDMLLPGSDTCYREELGAALEKYAQKIKNRRIEKIGKEFSELGTLWRDYIRKLSAISYYLEHLDKYLASLTEKAEALYSRERNAFTALQEAALSLCGA